MKQNVVSHITSLSKNTHFSRFASGKFNNLEVEDAEIGIFYFSLKRLLSLYLGKMSTVLHLVSKYEKLKYFLLSKYKLKVSTLII